MTKFAYATALALVLAACSGGTEADADGDGTITADEASEAVAANGRAVKPKPGQYKMSMSIAKLDIPNAPPEMAKMMGDGFGMNFEYCLTEEEAEQGFEESLKKGQDDNCTFERMNINGNDIDVAMKCAGGEAGDTEGTMKGTISPTKVDLTFKGKRSMGPMGEADIEMSMVQERIGDCK